MDQNGCNSRQPQRWQGWVVRWWIYNGGPWFWYYRTKRRARQVATTMLRLSSTRAEVHRVEGSGTPPVWLDAKERV